MSIFGCRRYRHEITQGSPLFPLVKAFQREGITDGQRDAGYHQIDYSKPGRWGKVEGAGDCYIDAREDLEVAAAQWKKFRAEFKAVFGGNRLPWDYEPDEASDPQADPEPGAKPIKAAIEAALLAARGDLSDAGPDPASDHYRSTLAEALYLWVEFPNLSGWKYFDAEQRANVLGRFRRLDELGFGRFKAHLVEHGGCGNIFNPVLGTKVSNYARTGVLNNPAAFLLYYAMEFAGLNPRFVELTGLKQGTFACDEPIRIRLSVGMEVAGGWRIFDPLEHISATERTDIFYPMSNRQALSSHRALLKAGAAFYAQQIEALRSEERWYSDGYMADFSSLTGALLKSDDKASFIRVLEKTMPSLHPLIRLEAIYEFDVPEPHKELAVLSSQPPLRGHPVLDHMRMTKGNKEPKNDEGNRLSSLRLLAADSRCFTAHVNLAKIEADSGAPDASEKAAWHFATAASVHQSGHKDMPRLMLLWGQMELKIGKVESAASRFRAALDAEGGKAADRGKAAHMLALLAAKGGDFEGAADLLDRAAESLLSEGGEDEKSLEALYDWLDSAWASSPPAAEAFHHVRFAAAAARLHSKVAVHLLRQGVLAKAEEAQLRALRGISGVDKLNLLLVLHEIYLREGKAAAAETVWQGIWNIVRGR